MYYTALLYCYYLVGRITCNHLTNYYTVSGTGQGACMKTPGRHLGLPLQIILVLGLRRLMATWGRHPDLLKLDQDKSRRPHPSTDKAPVSAICCTYDRWIALACSYLLCSWH